MKRLRVSIGWLMAAVVIVSLDLCCLRWLLQEPWVYSGREPYIAALTLSPMLNVLVIAGLTLIRDLWRRGESGAFRTGFFVAGAVAMLIATVVTQVFTDPILENLVSLIEPWIASIDKLPDGGRIAVVAILLSLVYFLPQLVLAFAGGLLNSRFGGLVVVRRLERAGSVESALTGKHM